MGMALVCASLTDVCALRCGFRLACSAFIDVFRRRQTQYHVLLTWLEGQLREGSVRREGAALMGIVGGRGGDRRDVMMS